MDDNGYKTYIRIQNAIHVPILADRLISTQQFVQQNEHLNKEGAIKSTHLVLKRNTSVKSAPYHSKSNLSIRFTMSVPNIAHAYITKHIPLNKDYFEKESNHV